MALHAFRGSLLALSWLVVLNWAWRVAVALRKLPTVPNLLHAVYDPAPEAGSSLLPSASSQRPFSEPFPLKICVVVPACNEEPAIGVALRSLLAIEGVAIEIIAIDDRSTDATGKIMDSLASLRSAPDEPRGAKPPALRVIHIDTLPDGWLGKPHAMATAARQTAAEWLLFTDGDVIFRPDALRRVMQFVSTVETDHLVVQPTLILKSFGERMMMSCVDLLAIWIVRPWKIPDPRATRDSIGIGAFNMVRRSVYTAVGGYESLRMDVLDDLRLGYKIKRAGYRQRVAFGRGLISVRWAVGARGVLQNLKKNAFAVFGFRPVVVIASCAGLAVLGLLPFATPLLALGIYSGLPHFLAIFCGPAVALWATLFVMANYVRRYNGISPAHVIAFPVGVCLFLFAILRSMAVTLRDGGVRWRGTLYPLADLRKNAGPLR